MSNALAVSQKSNSHLAPLRPVGDLLLQALFAARADAKTWYIEMALEGLGFDLSVLRDEVAKQNASWEPGVAP